VTPTDRAKFDALVFTTRHTLSGVLTVTSSLSAALKDGTPMPTTWDSAFWERQAQHVRDGMAGIDALAKIARGETKR